MATELGFCLLGPLAVRRGQAAVPVPPGKQRVILAMLLLNAGRLVRVAELAESLWDAAPPPSGTVAVQNYVMRLRQTLGDVGRARIITQPGGYLIRVEADELDVSRFEALLAAARAAARDGSWDRAAGHAGAALRLWRGEPLADVDSEALRTREVPRLEELRLQTLETRIDADLHLGRHADVIAEAQQLVRTHPLRERLHGLLMTALYRDGRQGEALAAYQRARQALVAQLGAEPGTGLRELHRQMLVADPALDYSGTDGLRPAVPRLLPARVRHFTGRSRELAELSGSLGQTGGTLVITAIGGTAGVGKTALAVHWAHQAADRFPDGQLYVNLRGYDAGPPITAADALARFLRALGVSGQDIPPEEDERADRYRSLLAGRRMLVVLDNAESAGQVRPLLPGTAGCAVLVTSRDALAGLVARDGAHRLDLDLLQLGDALRLLRELIGERADTDQEATATLAEQCCRLPLALRVAAELATARPDASLADLADDLADQRRRLDLLDAGADPRTAVRAVFSWSYRHLSPDAARTFRLLSLHPGADLDRYAAAALADVPVELASHLLDTLVRAHLIEPNGPGRYRFHDLLRAYARELAIAEDAAESRGMAMSRLSDYYLYAAAAAMDVAFPAESDRRPNTPPSTVPCPAFTSIGTARTWLDAERPTLAEVVAHTAVSGWPGHAIRLAATLFRYLEVGGHYTDIAAIHEHARQAARDAGDRAAEAEMLRGLIVIDLRQGRYQQAADRLQEALAVYRETGNRAEEARELGNLGIAFFLQGRYQQATGHLQQALAVYHETGNRVGEAHHLTNLGLVELRLGIYRQASRHLDRAVAICRDTGDLSGEAYALSNLGVISLRLGHHQEACQHLDQALTACRDSGNRDCEAYALGNLGITKSRLGHHQQASQHLDRALTICRETGDRSSEAEALNSLGEVLFAAGQPGDAQAQHASALDLASKIGDKYEQARAHDGLGRSHHHNGDPGRARQHWQQALALHTDLGTPEADHIRIQLTAASADNRQCRRGLRHQIS